MSRIKIIGLALVVVLAAFAIAAGSASAVSFNLEANGAPLAAGTPISGTSSGLTFATRQAGNVVCEDSSLTGTVQLNGSSIDVIEIESLTTRGSSTEPLCSTDFRAGPGTFTAKDLPWSLKLTAKGVALMEAESPQEEMFGKPEGVMFSLGWGEPKQECRYWSKEPKADYPVNAAGESSEPLTLSFDRPFSLFADSGKQCGNKGGNLQAAYAITADGYPVYAALVPKK